MGKGKWWSHKPNGADFAHVKGTVPDVLQGKPPRGQTTMKGDTGPPSRNGNIITRNPVKAGVAGTAAAAGVIYGGCKLFTDEDDETCYKLPSQLLQSALGTGCDGLNLMTGGLLPCWIITSDVFFPITVGTLTALIVPLSIFKRLTVGSAVGGSLYVYNGGLKKLGVFADKPHQRD